MTRISSSYLPEAADSRLVPLDIVDTPEAWEHRLRLRLHMAARLLFGQPIFICEGWSLDSTSFLMVAGEILEAVEDLTRRGAKRPANIEAYSPFRIGLTRPGTYLTCYGDYLARDDCHWSGIPIFRDDADLRSRLHHALRQLDLDSIDGGQVGDLFERHLANGQVSRAIGRLAAYADRGPDLRVARGEISPASYLDTVRPLFEDVGQCLQGLGKGVWHQEILSLLDLLRKDASRMTSSSVVMAGARGIVSPDLYPAVEHASRLAYMDVHSRHEGASFSAPALTEHAPEILRVVDGHLANRRAGIPGALEFGAEDGNAGVLFEALDRVEDWTPVWKSIVRLVHMDDWQKAIAELRATATGKPLDELLQRGDFGTLEKLLAVHCPDLVLKQSVGERWGLGFRIRGRRLLPEGTDRALDILLQTAVLTLPLWFFVAPAAAGAAAVAWAITDKLVDKSLPSAMKPLSRKTIGSSLFRLFRR